MATCTTALFFLLLLATAATTTSNPSELEVLLQMAQAQVFQAKNYWLGNLYALGLLDETRRSMNTVALTDCAKLYEESESRLSHMVSNKSSYTKQDALIWISAVMTNHRTCLDGLQEKGHVDDQAHNQFLNTNLTSLLGQALALYSQNKAKGKGPPQRTVSQPSGDVVLESWSPATYKADFTVAQDGSGSHRTIKDAVDALAAMGHNRGGRRAVIHVKAGVYHEKVVIGSKMHNVMFVGDGIDRTIITGNRNVVQGSTTMNSASFDVSGDGFWARDITFENTAGPDKHQAVALKVSSDLSVFYRCSFKGYQDTLYVHSNRQFYRDCRIYGTVDFIFGDAAAVLQNCDIFVRNPMSQQSNFITAQGRDDPYKPTGISIQGCRIRPASQFVSSKTFLGRPWKKYSRTVFLKSDLDGLIHPRGWGEWDGNFALSTLYYGEYMNIGNGASTQNRVNWPGFHVLRNAGEATPFGVSQFLQGERWIPASGVPFSSGI